MTLFAKSLLDPHYLTHSLYSFSVVKGRQDKAEAVMLLNKPEAPDGPRPRSACPVDWIYCSGACLKKGKDAHNCWEDGDGVDGITDDISGNADGAPQAKDVCKIEGLEGLDKMGMVASSLGLKLDRCECLPTACCLISAA
jgi:hypothetical protein